MNTKDTRAYGVLLVIILFFVSACGGSPDESASNSEESLTIYSGRSESLVAPVIEAFQESTGIRVEVRYGDTAQLAVALTEEGDASKADIFWAQDAGALGALASNEQFTVLPDSLLMKVAPSMRSADGSWVATNARARVLAFSPGRVAEDELPMSVLDLTDSKFKNRVGWAPTNGSFQSFVSAMRELVGDETTRAWLIDMKANGAKSYPKNSAILQGIANGEVDLGLPNHYYLLRFKSEDAGFPVEQTSFASGDPGNLVNVAGVGILASSKATSAAIRFVSFLLSPEMQQFFVDNTFEFAVTTASSGGDAVEAAMPEIDLNSLRKLESTLEMLREVELL
ncbi:MAG: iron ABC transporter substrate-binding protein [Rhodothermales bacterium]|nr:iron ABC transporter substrate-binding protein [Rhodothermales bacterium]